MMSKCIAEISIRIPRVRLMAVRVWIPVWLAFFRLMERTCPGEMTVEVNADRAIKFIGDGMKVKVI